VTGPNRRKLTALVVAATKLDAAAGLVKEAVVDVAGTDFERWELQEVAKDLDKLIAKISIAIEETPSLDPRAAEE
jgi:hypothetical protein